MECPRWQRVGLKGRKHGAALEFALVTYLEADASVLVPLQETPGLGPLQGHLSFPSALPSGLVLSHCQHQGSNSVPFSNLLIRKSLP